MLPRFPTRLLVLLFLLGLPVGEVPLRAEEGGRPDAITVVTDDVYPPYIFRSDDGKLQGILKDTWDLWSLKTGIRVDLKGMDWAAAQAEMRAGHADVIDTLFETPERRKFYEYSPPHADIEVSIYFHESISGISGVDTLKGFFIGVKDGDACIEWLAGKGITSVIRLPSYEAMVEAARRQQLRLLCIDQPPATYYLLKKGMEGEFRHTAPLYSGQFHWAVRKGESELFRLVSDGYARITPAERKAIEDKWRGTALPQAADRFLGWLPLALQAAAAMALFLGVWAWALRRQVGARTRQLENALAALGSSERHYRALVSLTPVGVFETDAEGRVLFVNERWTRISTIDAVGVDGRFWIDLLDEDDRERVRSEWQAAQRNRVMFQSEFRYRSEAGGVTWVLGQTRARREGDGLVSGHIGTITDITTAKLAEAALAASEARFRAIVDSINDAIFIHDGATGELLAVNRRMLEMYGYDDPSQVLGSDPGAFSEGVAPYDQDSARRKIAMAVAGEPQMFEWRARTRSGQVFWCEVSVRRVRIGEAERILAVVRDITHAKQAEQTLTARTEELERSNADLEQFAYVASHDLREPLRMVSSYMALLERRYAPVLDKDGMEFIAFAKEGAVRMDRLVQDLLEFSRVGRVGDHPAPTPLGEVVEGVTHILRQTIAEKKARVIMPELLPTVVCRANEMFLLFQNLISNAVKFHAADRTPEIVITATRTGEGWEIAVADNGIGIDPAYHDRIFKIFQRLHTRDHYEGTGIGLSICKKIVQQHGGRIWVDSHTGEGAVFRFTLKEQGSGE